ncbi:MAG: DNA-binding response regulator [Bacteroidetes bacterium]|nr:MAG: DNA-binding response regulator [Bacteroidota bacterium]
MKILIIEDEPGIAAFIRQGLEEEGFEVEIADNGDDGLRLALSGRFDLLLVDWMLPGQSGLEVCTAFRAEDSTTPILFLTAKDTVQDAIEGLRAGANDYIRKPFHFEELLERIRVQLRGKSDQSEALKWGDVVVDLAAHRVWRDGHEIALTPKEFDLLTFLIRNKGRVCRRNQIIKQVWDIHFEYNTGIIDVYINALRKKLNFLKDEDRIRTIRGVGYMARNL